MFQMSRPISMKKDGIQSRNRKMSLKSKKRKKTCTDASVNDVVTSATVADRSSNDTLSAAFNSSITSYIPTASSLQPRLVPIVSAGSSKLVGDERPYYGRYYPTESSVTNGLRKAGLYNMTGNDETVSYKTPIHHPLTWTSSSRHHHFTVGHYKPDIISGVV
jgi:Flp pilus assembly protein TadG